MSDKSEYTTYKVVERNYGANSRTTVWVRAVSSRDARYHVEDMLYRPGHIEIPIEQTPPEGVEVKETASVK